MRPQERARSSLRRASALFALACLGVAGAAQAAACGGDTVASRPNAGYDAGAADAGQDAGPTCPIPHRFPAVQGFTSDHVLRFFLSDHDLAVWSTYETTLPWDVREGRLTFTAFDPNFATSQSLSGGTAFHVDESATYGAVVDRVDRYSRLPTYERRQLGSIPFPFVVSAFASSPSRVYAVLGKVPCKPTIPGPVCTQPRGLAVASASLATSAEWEVLFTDDAAIRPSTPRGELAIDDRDVYFLSRAPTGVMAIRAVAASGGAARTLLEGGSALPPDVTGEPDAGDGGDSGAGPPCTLPEICIDADLTVQRDTVYWRGGGALLAMPAAGGAPRLVIGTPSQQVSAYAIDGDELFTIELGSDGRASVLRRTLSAIDATPVVITSRPFTGRRAGARWPRDTTLGVGPTALLVSGLSEPNQILGFCRTKDRDN